MFSEPMTEWALTAAANFKQHSNAPARLVLPVSAMREHYQGSWTAMPNGSAARFEHGKMRPIILHGLPVFVTNQVQDDMIYCGPL